MKLSFRSALLGAVILCAAGGTARAGSLALKPAPEPGHAPAAATDHSVAQPSHGADTAKHGVAEPTHAAAPSGQGAPSAEKGGHGGAQWGYSGQGGPENWARLSKDYHLCGAGANQSPIDLDAFTGASVDQIEFDYRLTPVEIVHNGHTIQVNYAPGSSITVAGKRYELLQFHFHAPSEHSRAGHQAAMEVHLVHKSADGSLAVLGAFMEVGTENLALREFWEAMPRQAGPARRDERVLINARDLLPPNLGYYRYMGSLTTPPCSEGVNWYVFAEPVSVSAEQLERFAAAVGANARPVQPVNQRLVLAPLSR